MPPVFDRLQYAKMEGEGLGNFSTADVTDSRCKSLFTFVSTVTEKLENRNKFQRRGKSYHAVEPMRSQSLTTEGWL